MFTLFCIPCVMTGTNQQQYRQQAGTSDIMQQADRVLDTNQRPKRKTTKPQHLKDFV